MTWCLETCKNPSCKKCGRFGARLDHASCRTSPAYIARQEETRRRLSVHVPDLKIEERDGATWAWLDGACAPVVFGHGNLTLRTNFVKQPSGWLPSRQQVGVPRLLSAWHKPLLRKKLAGLIRASQERFTEYREAEATLASFREIVGGVAAVERLAGDGKAVITVCPLTLTLEEARTLMACLWKVRSL